MTEDASKRQEVENLFSKLERLKFDKDFKGKLADGRIAVPVGGLRLILLTADLEKVQGSMQLKRFITQAADSYSANAYELKERVSSNHFGKIIAKCYAIKFYNIQEDSGSK